MVRNINRHIVKIDQYTDPHQFEPLLPQRRMEEFRARTRGVIEQSVGLSGGAHPATIATLRELVREMNSYYSNRIEGQSTHPLNIERALRQDFSDKPDVARLQRLALVHIEAERELEQRVAAGNIALTSEFLRQAHEALYRRLSPADRTTDEGRLIVPGAWRQEAPRRRLRLGRIARRYADPCCISTSSNGMGSPFCGREWPCRALADALCAVATEFRALVNEPRPGAEP
jgi:hypothetical protein